MAQELISHKVLSLDFWQDAVAYAGAVMPTGTIGCSGTEHPRRNDCAIGRAVHDLESAADRHRRKECGYVASSESAGGRADHHSRAARCPAVLLFGQKAV